MACFCGCAWMFGLNLGLAPLIHSAGLGQRLLQPHISTYCRKWQMLAVSPLRRHGSFMERMALQSDVLPLQVNLDAEAIRSEVEAAAATAEMCVAGHPGYNMVVSLLEDRVGQAQGLLPLLLPLASTAMRERHWALIFALLEVPTPTFLSLLCSVCLHHAACLSSYDPQTRKQQWAVMKAPRMNMCQWLA